MIEYWVEVDTGERYGPWFDEDEAYDQKDLIDPLCSRDAEVIEIRR